MERIALVTGASKGLGRQIVEDLSENGFFVYCLARDSQDLMALSIKLESSRPGGQAIICDFSNQRSIEGAMAQLTHPIDTIVHNVGGTIGIREPLFSAQEFQQVLDLNFLAAVELNYRLIPAMQARRFGRVIHVSSLAAVENHGAVAYASAKGMLNTYVRSLGSALHGSGVILTSILSGRMEKTEGTTDDESGKFKTSLKSVSNLVTFLASNEAEILSGSCIMADGGQGRVIPDWLT